MMISSYPKHYDVSEEIGESFEGSGGIDDAVSNLIKTVRLYSYCKNQFRKRFLISFVNKFTE
jgi:hypothetical protein